MSHGRGKTIYCNDGQELNVDDILKIFDEEPFENLKNKPKLFLIQACQLQGKTFTIFVNIVLECF